MINSLLLLAAFVPSSDVVALNDLFNILDRDQDGIVTSSEISDAQKPYFERALRVSDMNEDGALTRQELTAALQEPDRQRVSTNQRPDFDLTQFDTNKDGKLSKTEIPQPLLQRLSPLFERIGSDEIPLDLIRRMNSGQARKPENSPDSEKRTMQNAMSDTRSDLTPEVERLATAVKRLDTNADGRLSRDELKAAPNIARLLDRDRSGDVTADELRAIGKLSRDMSPSGNGEQSDILKGFFDRLDADKNGRLSGDELSGRMRSRLQQIDRNNDQSISREEFEAAIRRQNASQN